MQLGDACVAPTRIIVVGPGWGRATNASAAGVSHQNPSATTTTPPAPNPAAITGYYPCRGDACVALIAMTRPTGACTELRNELGRWADEPEYRDLNERVGVIEALLILLRKMSSTGGGHRRGTGRRGAVSCN